MRIDFIREAAQVSSSIVSLSETVFLSLYSIRPAIVPRGVGVTNASQDIQIDWYSSKSKAGASISSLDKLDTLKGWQTVLDGTKAWVQYDNVDFGGDKLNSVDVRVLSKTGGTILVQLNNGKAPVIARVRIPIADKWKIVSSPISECQSGIHNQVVQLGDDRNVQIDRVSFR